MSATAAALIALAAAASWLAYEWRHAPVVDDDTGPDPWLAEEVRAALSTAVSNIPSHPVRLSPAPAPAPLFHPPTIAAAPGFPPVFPPIPMTP